MRELRKNNTPNEKLGWYYRHWKGMNLSIEETKTYQDIPWDVQCKADWRINGELQAMKAKAKAERKVEEAAKTTAQLAEKIEKAETLDEVFPD